MAEEISARDTTATAVAAYKAILQAVIDRRPSGTRRRLANALGKHRSFVTQITNPAYPVPIPASHLKTIFEICHFSPQESAGFMEAYQRAHPGRASGLSGEAGQRALTLMLPDFGETRNRAFDALVQDLVARLARHEDDLD
jgi:hypothetical protein